MSGDKIVMAIGMPMARGIQPQTMRCLLAALADLRKEPYVTVHLFDPIGYQIDHARNVITQEALNFVPDLTHIMWIDDDMTFAPDAIRRLLDHNLPIVGGLCFNRRHPYGPVLVNFTERGFAFDYDYPEGLNQYDGTGAAFLLTKKEVYLRIHEKHPEGPWTITTVGEDISFCRRAASVGYKIMVDTRVKIGHISPDVVIDEEFAKRNRVFRANPWFRPEPMPDGDPIASVIIPTWNQRPEWLRAAVNSALAQRAPVDVIVVDSGSDEPITPASLGRLDVPGIIDHRFDRVRILRIEKNPGHPWDALNLGIREMVTPWFTWLSSDDLYYPIKIGVQHKRMIDEGAFASFHSYDVMIAEGHVHETVFCPLGWRTIEEQRKPLAESCAINGLTVMIHRTVLDDVRLPNGDFFDSRFRIAADWDLWNRIAIDHLWLGMNDILATRREYRGEVMNASQRYARDPEMRALWQAEDARIRAKYAITPTKTPTTCGCGPCHEEDPR